jgi:hypothetical protein
MDTGAWAASATPPYEIAPGLAVTNRQFLSNALLRKIGNELMLSSMHDPALSLGLDSTLPSGASLDGRETGEKDLRSEKSA